FLAILVETAVINAVQCAERRNRLRFSIVVSVEVRAGVAWLTVKDDAGDSAQFDRVITCLNDGQPVPSSRSASGGRGLALCRDFLRAESRIATEWHLKCVGDVKTLRIPLGRVSKKGLI